VHASGEGTFLDETVNQRVSRDSPPRSDASIWNRLTLHEAQLFRVLLAEDGPVGARIAARKMADRGINISEGTVSRLFLRLDDLGLSAAVGRQGRLVTAEGRRVGNIALANERRNEELDKAFEIRHVPQLIDLLQARRGLEREVAYVAAERATDDEIATLQRLAAEYQARQDLGVDVTACSMSFHRSLVTAAHSPLLEALAKTLLDERLEKFEPLLQSITESAGAGSRPHEHQQIVQAVANRDADAAEALMAAHLTRMIDDAKVFSAVHDQVSQPAVPSTGGRPARE
jgi:DNA-binding FadR family transcriptional regulator